MTIGIDTSRINAETYKEYCKHEHTCVSYQDFLLVRIMRLENSVLELLDEIDEMDDAMEDMTGGGY